MTILTSNKEKILVLDSSFFFITQQIPENLDGALFTTPEILSEILDPLNKIRIGYLIDFDASRAASGDSLKNRAKGTRTSLLCLGKRIGRM